MYNVKVSFFYSLPIRLCVVYTSRSSYSNDNREILRICGQKYGHRIPLIVDCGQNRINEKKMK